MSEFKVGDKVQVADTYEMVPSGSIGIVLSTSVGNAADLNNLVCFKENPGLNGRLHTGGGVDITSSSYCLDDKYLTLVEPQDTEGFPMSSGFKEE